MRDDLTSTPIEVEAAGITGERAALPVPGRGEAADRPAPPSARQDELLALRRRLLSLAAKLLVIAIPVVESARLLTIEGSRLPLPGVAAGLGAGGALLLLRAGRQRAAAASLLLPLGVALLARAGGVGGAGEDALGWFAPFILVSALLAGRQAGWIAAGFGTVAAIAVATVHLPSSLQSAARALESISVFVLSAALLSALETALTRALSRSQAAERALRLTTERYALAAEGAGYGAWEWDPRSDLFWMAPGVQAIRGLPPEERWLDRAGFRAALHPADVDRTLAVFEEHLRGDRVQLQFLCRLCHRDGRWIWVEGHGAAAPSDDGAGLRLFGSVRDVTARKLMEQALHRQAFYDELTGLPNRALFLDRLQQSIRRARRQGEATYAVLFLDLDRFKVVNDSLGHDVGDLLLAEFGRRLLDAVRGVDTAARLGGDEFAVLLEGVGTGEVQRAVDRIQEELEKPFILAGRELFIGASVGVLEGSLDYDDPQEALRDADLAMYSAKGSSRSVGRFEATLREEAAQRLDLDQAILRGLERDEMEPWFQPMFHLRTGALLGFEALVRWRRDDGRLMMPDDFVPRADETGSIARIDRRVVEKACFAAAAWNREREEPVGLSVNLSAWLFRDEGLPDFLERLLERSGLDPSTLHLELTESVFLDDVPGVGERLERLRDMGLRLAVDDFGTGYSSMAYLHRFRVHRIKVDRAFVQEDPGAGPGPLCRAILGMAAALEVDVVAEGIETDAQQRALLDLGCYQGQGWLLGRALPAAAARELALEDQELTTRTIEALPAV